MYLRRDLCVAGLLATCADHQRDRQCHCNKHYNNDNADNIDCAHDLSMHVSDGGYVHLGRNFRARHEGVHNRCDIGWRSRWIRFGRGSSRGNGG